jgi:hypothetical protein
MDDVVEIEKSGVLLTPEAIITSNIVIAMIYIIKYHLLSHVIILLALFTKIVKVIFLYSINLNSK